MPAVEEQAVWIVLREEIILGFTIEESLARLCSLQPCLDWVNTIPRSENYTVEDITEENTVYLIPNYDKKGDEDEFIKQHYSKIFDFELQGWKGRGTVFPENRTYD